MKKIPAPTRNPALVPALALVLALAAACSTASRGSMALESGDYQSALDMYQQALAQDPGSAHLRARLGLTRFRMGDYPGAVREFEQALAITPGNDFATLYLGLSLIGNSERERGFEVLETYRVPFKFVQSRVVADEARRLRGHPEMSLAEITRAMEAAVTSGVEEQRQADEPMSRDR
ncbi:MAG: tetratricopeptide repeat protein [Desulfovibrionaceae bacterium]|nr:tetratricopeptide repeat protein [Desulfovibrionaceae bacterium]